MDHNVRLALLVVLLFVYLFICAGMFHALEPWTDASWLKNSNFSFSPEDLRNSTAENRNATAPFPLVPRSYFESFFYMMSVITTIGYGHIVPVNGFAKFFTAISANFGIPLVIYILAHFGSKVSNLVLEGEDRFLRRVPGPYGRRTVTVMLVELFGLFFILMVPGSIFARLEGWNFADGTWYAFVSVTTIGFGDLVSGQRYAGVEADPNLPLFNFYILCKCCYILVGMTWVATLWFLIADVLPPVRPEGQQVQKAEEPEPEPVPRGTLLSNQA
ncbi:PREDICTED: potassium channel subfamily K member 9-like isoform X1 [Branchiostoma belcheri]|uniref:Potassium channel subfamily K member 9-like isoform X1 n=1 Tax=Branchiostoma belcheri TaxID=7741 RepID=A0A6P4YYW5_BRABE|nr:PREDICTED: potassium channel subfamily K member 9-like isoform X1 [Branchiostoma belcheri]